jgi:metal-dependent HD superfamily phosphatase/phosphodiesterase
MDGYKEITLDDVIGDQRVKAYVDEGDRALSVLGYTEHGAKHSTIVAERAREIMLLLGYKERRAELAAVAGYMHDIGNAVGRVYHEQIGAALSTRILEDMGMDPVEVAAVASAIGNDYDEGAEPVSAVSAAVILADKSDVRRDRVRNPSNITFDVHDRVNYAAESAELRVDRDKKRVTLDLKIDPSIAKVMEYFEIFAGRMALCRKAVRYLGCNFELVINDTEML